MSSGQHPLPADDSAASGSVTAFIRDFCSGDEAAANELWSRYFPRMRRLASTTLQSFPKRVSDADDAVQSAFMAFWQRARRGQVADGFNRNDLWNLLTVITVRKARKHRRDLTALKRGGSAIRGESEMPDGSVPFRLDEALSVLPTQELDLRFEEILIGLPEELRTIALLRLMDHTTSEIAQRLQCTERKIQRKIALIRLRLEEKPDPSMEPEAT